MSSQFIESYLTRVRPFVTLCINIAQAIMANEDSTYDMESDFEDDYRGFTLSLDNQGCESLIHAYGIMKAIQKYQQEHEEPASTARELFDCIAFNTVRRHVQDMKNELEQEEQEEQEQQEQQEGEQEGEQEGQQEGQPRA